MAPVVPAPCWASRHLMPGVPTQPARRQRTPPAARRPPRRNRPLEAVVQAGPTPRPRNRPRRIKSPAVRIIRKRQTLRRISSEPALPSWSEDNQTAEDAAALPRFSTCLDVCSPGSGFLSLTPSPSTSSSPAVPDKDAASAVGKVGRYTEQSKVVISVTVEGCSGPVRALVRLGATVEETIAIVAHIYQKEGRRPRLENGGAVGDGAGSLELYQSYFCLQGLNKSDRLGDVGGRSFYMRRSGKDTVSSTLSQSSGGEISPDGRLAAAPILGGTHTCLIVSFLVKRLGKIARRGRKIWSILGCIASD